MESKPASFGSRYAEAFKNETVVRAYRYRPPYPGEVFSILASLLGGPGRVLDVGSGSGDIARPLVKLVGQVDAVDFSQSMIDLGRGLPGGDDPGLRWIYGKVEEVALDPPYALITAGSSIHWPAWDVAFPRFRSMLVPGGFLALVYRRIVPMPWDAEMRELLAEFSDHWGHRGAHAIKELETRGFFRRCGEQETAPIPFVQSLDDYVEGLHSRSSFSRELMGQERAADLDQWVKALLLRYHPDGVLPLQVVGSVTWGVPESGS